MALCACRRNENFLDIDIRSLDAGHGMAIRRSILMAQAIYSHASLLVRMRMGLVAFCLALLGGCAAQHSIESIGAQAEMRAPERATGYVEKPGWTAKKFMVAAANPLATDAGYRILRAGGSAVDAAIAVQLVLSLVEPQSSGVGGGAFMLVYDAASPGGAGKITAYEGRETAPAGATPDMFLSANGRAESFNNVGVGGLSVGVPGAV